MTNSKVDIDKILVTVLMPNYNCGHHIELAINSILNQSHQNWELIIIDDYSTDNSRNIINKIISTDSKYNIHVIANKMNYGTYYSLNEGLKLSKGEFITKLDSDDVYDKDKIKEQLEFCLKNNIEACTCNIMRGYIHNGKPVYIKEAEDSSLMFSRNVFSKLGYYDNGRFDCDSEYYHRVKKYFDVSNLDKDLYYARYRLESLTSMEQTGTKLLSKGSKIREAYKINYRSSPVVYMSHPKYTRKYELNHIQRCPIECTFRGSYHILRETDEGIYFNNNELSIVDTYYKVNVGQTYKIHNQEHYTLEILYLDGTRVIMMSNNVDNLCFEACQEYIQICVYYDDKGVSHYKPLIVCLI